MRLSSRRRVAGPIVLLLFALAPHAAWSQGVLLQIRPRAGDTLRMRLDQQSSLTGTRWSAKGETSSSVVTTLRMYSRAVVESTTAATATVLAITDSVAVSSTDVHERALAEQTRRMLEGKQVRLHLTTDGTVEMADAANGSVDTGVSEVVSLMPAAFPRTAVRVHETWAREMPLPPRGGFGGGGAGRLLAQFRLDSLSRTGDVAYLTMHGDIAADRGGAPVPQGGIIQQGTVDGTMQLDRRRGWLSESQFTIIVHSTVTPPPASRLAPMQFQMKIVQRTRTMEKR